MSVPIESAGSVPWWFSFIVSAVVSAVLGLLSALYVKKSDWRREDHKAVSAAELALPSQMSEAYKGLVEDLSKQLADQIESGNKLWIEFRKMQQALFDAESKHRECETRVLRLEAENKTQSRRISALETRQQIIRPDTDYIKGG